MTFVVQHLMKCLEDREALENPPPPQTKSQPTTGLVGLDWPHFFTHLVNIGPVERLVDRSNLHHATKAAIKLRLREPYVQNVRFVAESEGQA